MGAAIDQAFSLGERLANSARFWLLAQASPDAETASETWNLLELGVSPWLVIFGCLAPLLLLVLSMRIYPTQLITAMIGGLAAMGALIVFAFPTSWVGYGYGALLLLAGTMTAFCLFDLLTIPSIRDLSISRQMARVASIGVPHTTKLMLDNRTNRSFVARIVEDAADGLTLEPPFHSVQVAKNKRTILEQTATSHRRGAFKLENVYVELSSLFRMWRRQCELKCESELHVYPDIRQISEYALLARTNRLSQIGVRRTRKAGQDNDFERLRDYQRDDNYRHIDWRSTARRQKMTVRQFQTDQSQRVIFLLDCGRMMTNEHERLSLLDYSLNAILMLSYVALDQGDSVGMLAFSDSVHTYVPPASGRKQMNRLLHAGFNQFPQLVQSRFDEAFLYLSEHCRRRSLVVLVSNVIDEVNAAQIQNYMQNLVGSHLPLLVLLRDHQIFSAADHPNPDNELVFRSAAASQLLVWRDEVIRNVEARGAMTLDVFPEQMTASMVNQYLEIKARHLL